MVKRVVVFGTGFVGLVNMGYGFGNGFRAELEGFYRANGVSNALFYTGKVGQGNLNATAGTLRNYGFMINAYYDVDPNFFPESARFFQPYVGVGLGFGYAQLQNVRGREPASANQNGAALRPCKASCSGPWNSSRKTSIALCSSRLT